MIHTVTFNPAVDCFVRSECIRIGVINRTYDQEVFFGGKGINVSCVLSELGIQSRALGFTAGFTGMAIEQSAAEKGVLTDFVHLDSGISRINFKISSDQETEFNSQGPEIPPEKLDEFYKKLDGIKNGDTIVLAGSIPKSLPEDIYNIILERLSCKSVNAAVDACGDLLINTLKHHPFLIKPNRIELGDIFKKKLETISDIAECAVKLKSMGAQNVLVSMDKDGAFLLDSSGKQHYIKACAGKTVNSVGAGDSMLAGFIAGCDSQDYSYALKLGTACGSATAFSSGLCCKADVIRLLKQIEISQD